MFNYSVERHVMKASVQPVPGLSSDPPLYREYRVTTGKISQIEVTENSLFYWSRTT